MGSLSLTHCLSLCGVQIKKRGPRGWGKWSYHFHLAFPPDSQLCRASAFMILSGHLTLSKGTWPRLFRGWFCVLCEYTVNSCWEFDTLEMCSLIGWNVSCQSLWNHTWLFSLYSKTEVWGGFKCIDVGNRGESRKRVTEGGQECEQGMLGNQQVLSCVFVNPSLQ